MERDGCPRVRARALIITLLSAVLVAAVPTEVGAQATPTTTNPGSGPATTATSQGGSAPPVPEDGSTTTTDPLVDELPGETVPETDQTVPQSTGSYGGQRPFVPQEVLWSSVRAAERKKVEAEANHERLIERVRSARIRRKALLIRRERLVDDTSSNIQDLETAEIELQERAVAAFVTDEAVATALYGSLKSADYDSILDLRSRWVLLDVVLDQDTVAIEDYNTLRDQLSRSALSIVEALRRAEFRIDETVDEAEHAKLAVVQAEDELVAFRAGSAVYISGVVFPVAPPYDLPLIDSFGFPRMPGTPDEHWHEGIDLFAPSGTPLLAAERGVIIRIGNGRLGGLTFWLRGESGADWYYAHLQSHAAGLAVGNVVEAGQVLGFVGNTGNAVSTPPHLHLEMHPGGDEPVNPYPLLKVVSDRDLADS